MSRFRRVRKLKKRQRTFLPDCGQLQNSDTGGTVSGLRVIAETFYEIRLGINQALGRLLPDGRRARRR